MVCRSGTNRNLLAAHPTGTAIGHHGRAPQRSVLTTRVRVSAAIAAIYDTLVAKPQQFRAISYAAQKGNNLDKAEFLSVTLMEQNDIQANYQPPTPLAPGPQARVLYIYHVHNVEKWIVAIIFLSLFIISYAFSLATLIDRKPAISSWLSSLTYRTRRDGTLKLEEATKSEARALRPTRTSSTNDELRAEMRAVIEMTLKYMAIVDKSFFDKVHHNPRTVEGYEMDEDLQRFFSHEV